MTDDIRQPSDNGRHGRFGHRNHGQAARDTSPVEPGVTPIDLAHPPKPAPASQPTPAPQAAPVSPEPAPATPAASQPPVAPQPAPAPPQPAAAAPVPAPQPAPTPQPAPVPAPAPATPSPAPAQTAPTSGDLHASIHRSLRWIKYTLVVLVVLGLLAAAYAGSRLLAPKASTTGILSGNGGSSANYPAPAGQASSSQGNTINCLSQTGPDATTTSQSFVDIAGTECTYRVQQTDETLVLSGKLTGRNTEGTGMSVTINVNGKDCNGGESLNYSRSYTPMLSNCTFEVKANTTVTIKWRFLSPFGGTAAVLRSSKNIAPSINGVAVSRSKS